MFGTLVVVLPSAHRGGELVMRHAGREVVAELSGEEFSELKFAAFYADCEHEVRPVTEGHRVCLGNLLTSYRYRYVNLKIRTSGRETRIETSLANGSRTLDVTFESSPETVALPKGSPFGDWQTARLFAGPMPFTFSAKDDGCFVVIEGSRQDWVPRPVCVRNWHVSLFDESPLRGTKPILANAFTVEGVSYRWKRGRVIRPGGSA